MYEHYEVTLFVYRYYYLENTWMKSKKCSKIVYPICLGKCVFLVFYILSGFSLIYSSCLVTNEAFLIELLCIHTYIYTNVYIYKLFNYVHIYFNFSNRDWQLQLLMTEILQLRWFVGKHKYLCTIVHTYVDMYMNVIKSNNRDLSHSSYIRVYVIKYFLWNIPLVLKIFFFGSFPTLSTKKVLKYINTYMYLHMYVFS